MKKKKAVRKVSKDGRYGTKRRRPAGTALEPLYTNVVKSAATYAKKQVEKYGSVSLYIERLILKDKLTNKATKQSGRVSLIGF